MKHTSALTRLADQPVLDELAEPLARAVHAAYDAAGDTGRAAKNAMHGVWLGHPLHPVFTDVPIGAWTTALVLDAAAAARRDRGLARAADVAIAVGLAGAVGSAVTGLTDWSETSGRSRRTGLLHGLLNLASTTLFAASYVLRKSRAPTSGRACAMAGYALTVTAAYLGGDLVYGRRIGVTHAGENEATPAFTAVAPSTSVDEGAMTHARTVDMDLLLARRQGRVCALAHACSHLGGPLSEGTLRDSSVVCPWHGSEFALDDGRVINGPATIAQPSFDVREREGQIEVRE